jgi:hypothetical protein
MASPGSSRIALAYPRKEVERALLDTCGEPVRLRLQPPCAGGAGPADDRVEEPRRQSVLVTGQIDHDRDGPVDAGPAGPPNMLIDAEGLHSVFGPADAGLGFGNADQAVCQSTPRCRASGDTVVSS